MGEEPSEPPVPEPADAGDDALHLRVPRRALRRLGFAAVLLVVAAAGIGVGLALDGANDTDTAAPASRRRTSTTSSRATTPTVPTATATDEATADSATADDAATANSGAASGGTEGAEEAAGAADDAEAPPAEEAPAAVPAPVLPTAQLSLVAIPLGCAGVGPTLRVNWSTTNAAAASLKVGGVNTPIHSLNGSLLLDVECGRAIAARLTAFGVDHSTVESERSIVIVP